MYKLRKTVKIMMALMAAVFMCMVMCSAIPEQMLDEMPDPDLDAEPAPVLETEPEPEPVSGQIKAKKLKVQLVSYDPFNRVVTFKFNQKIKTKKLKVTIKRGKSGRNEVVSIKKIYSKSIKVNVNRLFYGFEYNYKISGIKKVGGKFVTLSGKFRAIYR